MTILDLIKKTAVIFDVQEILNESELDSITNNTQTTVLDNNEHLNRMFELSKIVLSEIYSHVAMEVEVVAKADGYRIDKRALGNVGRIVSVKNQYGKVNYQIKDNEIIVEDNGDYIVKCIVVPNTMYLFNEIDTLNGVIGDDLLVNGLNAYYCLSAGLFEEYNVYNARYIDVLSSLKNPKVFAMPCRSWHE